MRLPAVRGPAFSHTKSRQRAGFHVTAPESGADVLPANPKTAIRAMSRAGISMRQAEGQTLGRPSDLHPARLMIRSLLAGWDMPRG
jgi:hypothetical protein